MNLAISRTLASLAHQVTGRISALTLVSVRECTLAASMSRCRTTSVL
jgi:hypothetical protein